MALSQGLLSEERRQSVREILEREWRVLGVILVIIVLMNIPYGRYVLYPFTLYSTWVHEFCHGFAAILTGGTIKKIVVYQDTSGVCYYTYHGGTFNRVFIASAGYMGTAIVGCLLLLFRRTKRGPRIGTAGMGALMVLISSLYVRNVFGFIVIFSMGVFLTICGLALPSQRMRDLFVLVAATTSLNAMESIHDLYGYNTYVNGEGSSTDAHTVAEYLFLPYWFWASLWFFLSLVLTAVGLLFAIDDPNHVEELDMCG